MGRFETTAETYAAHREPYPPAFFAAAAEALTELRRLGRFGQAKLLGTFDATPKGRHYMG
jgi:hypothetical protein